MNLVQKVRNLCNSKKITFAELERALGFSNGQVRRWEKTKPGIDKIQKVADYFDVSVDYLLGREKEEYSGEQEDDVQMFRDKDAFDNLSPEDQEKVLETLREQADFLIHKYQKHKENK